MPAYSYIYYGQRQNPWAPHILGFGNVTIHDYGCLLCAISSMVHKDPDWTNQRLKETGQFDGSNLYTSSLDWELAFDGLVNQIEYYRNGSTAMPNSKKQTLKEHTDAGGAAIIQLDFSASSGLQTHYAAVQSVDANLNIFILDPWYHDDPRPVSLNTRYAGKAYGYNLFDAVPYDSVEPPAPGSPALGKVLVDLKFRDAPNSSANTFGRLDAGQYVLFTPTADGNWAKIPRTAGGKVVTDADGNPLYGYSMLKDAGSLYIETVASAARLKFLHGAIRSGGHGL